MTHIRRREPPAGMTARDQTTAEGLAYTSYLRVAAISAVVLIHVLSAIIGNVEIRGSRTWWAALALDMGVSWAVPVFVMVSGALLLRPAPGEGIGDFYLRRVRRIGVAVVAAHVLYFVFRATVMRQEITYEIVVTDVLQVRTFTHLYFFWIVLGLYSVTPLLRAFVRSVGERQVLFAGLALLAWACAVSIASATLRQLGASVAPWQPPALTMFIPYIGYFVVGYGLRDVVLGRAGVALAALSFVAATSLEIATYASGPDVAALRIPFGGHYLGIPLAIASICVYLIGRSALDHAGVLSGAALAVRMRRLGELTLGVFIIHFAILVLLRQYVPPFRFALVKFDLPLALAQWVVALVLSFAIAAAIARVPVLRRTIGL